MTNQPNYLEIVAHEIEEAKAVLNELYEERRQAIIWYRQKGSTVYNIAKLTGMSQPNVSKIVVGVITNSSAPMPPLTRERYERMKEE